MVRNEKKAEAVSIAEYFMKMNSLEGQSIAIMCLSAYAEGKAAGKAEERRKWEQRETA